MGRLSITIAFAVFWVSAVGARDPYGPFTPMTEAQIEALTLDEAKSIIRAEQDVIKTSRDLCRALRDQLERYKMAIVNHKCPGQPKPESRPASRPTGQPSATGSR